MHTPTILLTLAAYLGTASAYAVQGAADGFAKGVTGGGSLPPCIPQTTAELISFLGDDQPRVIALTKTFDFTGTEGTATGIGCAPWGTASKCQLAINQNGWCDNYQGNAPKVSVTYDKAGVSGIPVKSNKSLIGVGSSGVIKGKGLRIASGASNIIIQNIHITNLNPSLVWGGDAITLNGCDMVWIDHVKTSLIGRQHIVLGMKASNKVTISNCEIDGLTSWSATCDNHHYWALYFTGANDFVTLQNNYIHDTSGRSPRVTGSTVLHAVNNYWYANSGHAFEVDTGANILAEGNVFQNVKNVVDSTVNGKIFTSPDENTNKQCSSCLGRKCEINAYGSSNAYTGRDNSFFSSFQGQTMVTAKSANWTQSTIPKTAGFGKDMSGSGYYKRWEA